MDTRIFRIDIKQKRLPKRSLWLLVTVLIGIGTISAWVLWQSRGRIPAPALGGQEMTRVLKDGYNYQQRDPRWSGQRLGQREHAGTLGSHGCTVSAIANALSNLGMPITPGELNRRMSTVGGFNERGWLVWSALETASEGRARAQVFAKPSLSAVDHCLENGQYPIVKYLIGGVVQHWATVVGKQGRTYLIHDPLVDESGPIPLTSRTPIILSVRCIGAVQTQLPVAQQN